MKKSSDTDPEVREPRQEYDFSGGVRGRDARRFEEGTNVVILEPDLAEAFPDSESVNAALREWLRLRGKQRASS